MTSKSLQRLAALCIAALLTVFAAFAQDHAALVGKWNMTSEADGDTVDWTLILKDTDGKLTATLSSPDGEAPAKDFTYQDGLIKFKAPYQDQEYDIELKLSGDDAKAPALLGTWTGGGNSGRTHGTKAP